MANDRSEKLQIESKFEILFSKSKTYINSRNEGELASLKEDTENLKIKVNQELNNGGNNINHATSLKLMLSIIQKFNCSLDLMDNLKSKKPLCEQFDTKQMLDILLPHIRALVEYENWPTDLNTKKLEKDYEFIESLEDQHKRVLLSYLIEDWNNMDEVINLLKIGETYKNIAEKLVSLSLISDYREKNQ